MKRTSIAFICLQILLGTGGGRGHATTWGEPPAPWREPAELIAAGRFAAADTLVQRILEQAIAANDVDTWTRALIERRTLGTVLGAPETAILRLRATPWPDDDLSRAVLELHYAQSLVEYLRLHSYELRSRPRVATGDSLALESWDHTRLVREIDRSLLRAWQRREALGRLAPESWHGYIETNTYPDGIRSTLRDVVTYRWARQLFDTSLWSPEASEEARRLDLEELLSLARADSAGLDAAVADSTTHPLRRLGLLMVDLRAWHAASGRAGGALEAELSHLRSLRAAVDRPGAWRRMREHLEEILANTDAAEPWWSQGQAQLAEFLVREERPDGHILARAACARGAARHPDSVGGRFCASLLEQIERPEWRLEAMGADAPERRTIAIIHRNLPRLYFRAWRHDPGKDWPQSTPWLNPKDLDKHIDRHAPDLAWEVELPPTPDYRDHRTWTGLPACAPGEYAVVASTGPGFKGGSDRMYVQEILVSNLVVTAQPLEGGLEVLVRYADSGLPVEGASIAAAAAGTAAPDSPRLTACTGTDGSARLGAELEGGLQLRVSHEGHLARLYHVWCPRPSPGTARLRTFVYTDRAAYRPGQTVHWKVVAYATEDRLMGMRAATRQAVTVRLRDANGRVVTAATDTTNDFGSTSGSFALPKDRLLGDWHLEVEPDGRAFFRVEEYKRPTFDVALLDPATPPRPGRPAHLEGQARYLHGRPVSGGRVQWNLRRNTQVWRGWGGHASGGGAVYASGAATTDADGAFVLAFVPAAIPETEGGQPHLDSYHLHVDVTDPGGETRGADLHFRVGSVELLAAFESHGTLLAAGLADTFTVAVTDINGVPRAGDGRWRLASLVAPRAARLPGDQPGSALLRPDAYCITEGDTLAPRWDTAPSWLSAVETWAEGDTIAAGAAVHGDDGLARIVLRPSATGACRLLYEATDGQGRPVTARRHLYIAAGHANATGAGSAASAGAPPALPLLLEASTEQAAVGDTVRFAIASGLGAAPIHARLLVGERLWRSWFVDPDSTEIAIPVTASMHEGLSLQASVVRDHQLVGEARHVQVPWTEKRLAVTITPFRDHLRPGEESSFKVEVRGADARAAAAEVLALMYDRSLDAVAPLRLPDPVGGLAFSRSARTPYATAGERARGWHRRPLRRPPPGNDRRDLWPDYLRWFPGTRLDHQLNDRGQLRLTGVDPALARNLAAQGIPVAEPFVVHGEEYMVEIKSAVTEHTVRGETFEKYALDSVEDALSKQAGVVYRAGELYVRGGRSGEDLMSIPSPLAWDAVSARADFAETGFFLPHVELDEAGSAVIEFRAPEAATEWNVLVAALTRDLGAGQAERRLRTAKELLARPILPRFLREGDTADLRILVSNAGDTVLAGELRLEIEDPADGRDLGPAFDLERPVRRFRVEPGGTATVTYAVRTPAGAGAVTVRALARAGDRGDGEQHLLPVLPGRQHLLQSRFVALADSSRRKLHFATMAEPDPTRHDEQLTVTIDQRLLPGLLRALPYLVDYPYESTDLVVERFLCSGILSRLFADRPQLASLAAELADRDTPLPAWDADDPNRRLRFEETPWMQQAAGRPTDLAVLRLLDPDVASRQRDVTLARLRELQGGDGGFPWRAGGPSSTHLTLQVLLALARAAEFGLEAPDDVVANAWRYLGDQCESDGRRDPWGKLGPDLSTLLGHLLSTWPETVWRASGLTAGDRDAIIGQAWSRRFALPRLLKAYLALTLHRTGRTEDARALYEAVLDGARNDPDLGVYWQPEDRSWLWHNDHLGSHAVFLLAATEIRPDDPRRRGLAQWLLLNRQLSHWSSTRATAEAIYALARHLEADGNLDTRGVVRVELGGQERRFVAEPDEALAGSDVIVLNGDRIDPATMHTIVVQRESPGLAFVAATWTYSTERMPTAGDGDLLGVSRELFRCRLKDGRPLLTPLREREQVRIGDEIEVRLTVTARHSAEYVHVRDPRAAGCEPVVLRSGPRLNDGVYHHEEIRDAATSFFVPWLPAGRITLAYRVRAAMSGVFTAQPAVIQSVYAPEFGAHSAGDVVRIGD